MKLDFGSYEGVEIEEIETEYLLWVVEKQKRKLSKETKKEVWKVLHKRAIALMEPTLNKNFDSSKIDLGNIEFQFN